MSQSPECSGKYKKSCINVRKRRIFSIDCSPCGKYIVCAASRILISYDLLQQKQIAQSQEHHEQNILSVRYSSNGQLIASGSEDMSIIIWSAATLNQIGKTLQGHKNYVQSVSFSPDSLNLISGGHQDGSIRIWDVQCQKQVGRSIKVSYWILAVQYSHDGLQFLSAGNGSNLEIWSSENRQRLFKFVGHVGIVYTATYSFDDRYIVSGGEDRTIKIWDAITGQQIGDNLLGHIHDVRSVVLSADQRLIVSGSKDNTIRLWNFKTGKQEYLTHAKYIKAIEFSKVGLTVLSGNADKTISIIDIGTE